MQYTILSLNFSLYEEQVKFAVEYNAVMSGFEPAASVLQHGHGADAAHHPQGERRGERPVPGHVHQLHASDPHGRRIFQYVRIDEADPASRHGHQGQGRLGGRRACRHGTAGPMARLVRGVVIKAGRGVGVTARARSQASGTTG